MVMMSRTIRQRRNLIRVVMIHGSVMQKISAIKRMITTINLHLSRLRLIRHH